MNGRTILAGILLLQPAVGGLAGAFDSEAQIHESDLIVTGQVVDVREAAEVTGHAGDTEAEVAVADVWKGTPDGDRVVVHTPGGSLSNPGLAHEGSARFVKGEDVLLFLTREQETWRPWRTVFGKYTIRGTGREARIVGSMPPAFENLDGAGLASIRIDEAREEVRVIAAGRRPDGGVDVALRPDSLR